MIFTPWEAGLALLHNYGKIADIIKLVAVLSQCCGISRLMKIMLQQNNIHTLVCPTSLGKALLANLNLLSNTQAPKRIEKPKTSKKNVKTNPRASFSYRCKLP